jgi:hypothetical protein
MGRGLDTVFIVWKSRPVKGRKQVPFLLDNAPGREHPDCAAWKPLWCEHRGAGRVAWTALVVHAERRDGKPRQKLLHRLPTIRSCCVADPLCRAAWWCAVEATIDSWKSSCDFERGYIARDERAIRAKLRAVVPPPTRAGRRDFATYRRWREREHHACRSKICPAKRRSREEAARRPDEAPDRARRRADDEWHRHEQARRAAEASARDCADGWVRRPPVDRGERQERTRRAEADWARFEQAEREHEARYRRWTEGQERRQEEERRRQEEEEWRRQKEEEERRRLEEAWRRLEEALRRVDELFRRWREEDGRSGRGQHDGAGGEARSVPPSAAAALAVLGLSYPCTRQEIKAAYRKSMLKCHPDVGGTNAEAARVNAAYEAVK